jgi:carbohydrate kinase (thermoresistant glucokinase family)
MIVVIGGVAGSGKTTVGALLADRLGWPFADADAFHSAASVAKMASGLPLTDADRMPWLTRITAWMDEQIAAGASAVAGCSALRRRYRDQLLAARPSVRLVFLTVSREVAHARLVARHGHFFTAALMDSQFADLEPPQPDENVLVLDGAGQPAALVAQIIDRLGLTGGQPQARTRPDGE